MISNSLTNSSCDSCSSTQKVSLNNNKNMDPASSHKLPSRSQHLRKSMTKKKNAKKRNVASRFLTSIQGMLKRSIDDPMQKSRHEHERESFSLQISAHSKHILLDLETEPTAKSSDCGSNAGSNDVLSASSSIFSGDSQSFCDEDYTEFEYDSDCFDDTSNSEHEEEEEQELLQEEEEEQEEETPQEEETRAQNPMQQLVHDVNDALATYNAKEMELNDALIMHLAHARARYEAQNEMGAILSMRRVHILRRQHAKLVEVIQYLGAQEVQLVMQIIASNRGQEEATCAQNVEAEVAKIFAGNGNEGKVEDKALLQELSDLCTSGTKIQPPTRQQ